MVKGEIMRNVSEKKNSLGKAIDHSDNPSAQIQHQDDLLYEALRESFPASDPIAVSVTRIAKKPPLNQLSSGVGPGDKNE